MDSDGLWQRFQQQPCCVPALGLVLDVSRMHFDDGFLDQMGPRLTSAFEAMDALEQYVRQTQLPRVMAEGFVH